ncbi:MAG: hypothetical protein H5T85_08900 [Actinobacteria bacterium]|nr:hypothetical protein [Actinomycetota bacterium]
MKVRWQAIFGHTCIVLGCYLVAWGVNLLPVSSPTPLDILTKPLFWGLFSIFGGICANMHARCKCVRKEWMISGGKKQ